MRGVGQLSHQEPPVKGTSVDAHKHLPGLVREAVAGQLGHADIGQHAFPEDLFRACVLSEIDEDGPGCGMVLVFW